MNSIVDKLVSAYPEGQTVILYPVTKTSALQRLESLKAVIEEIEDVDRFPLGDIGLVLYALLKDVSNTCPDVGDFNSCYQGCSLFQQAAFEVIAKEFKLSR